MLYYTVQRMREGCLTVQQLPPVESVPQRAGWHEGRRSRLQTARRQLLLQLFLQLYPQSAVLLDAALQLGP